MGSRKKQVVLVTSQYAPFQVEFAETVNSESLAIVYHVIFTDTANKRPEHWLSHRYATSEYSICAPEGLEPSRVAAWVSRQIAALKPDVLIAGGIRNQAYRSARSYAMHNNTCAFGLWMEPPYIESSFIKRFARFMDYFFRTRGIDFIFSIGDRALNFHNKFVRNCFFVPYGIELPSAHDVIDSTSDRLSLVFAGGLVPRHDFRFLLTIIQRLRDEEGVDVDLIFSGDGPEKKWLQNQVTRLKLTDRVRFIEAFDTWEQRLRVYHEGAIFAYPTHHAGWGLVIPEALSQGNVVISSPMAESARFGVIPGCNGYVLELDEDLWMNHIKLLNNDRSKLLKMRKSAIASSEFLDARYVYKLFEAATRVVTSKYY